MGLPWYRPSVAAAVDMQRSRKNQTRSTIHLGQVVADIDGGVVVDKRGIGASKRGAVREVRSVHVDLRDESSCTALGQRLGRFTHEPVVVRVLPISKMLMLFLVMPVLISSVIVGLMM
jgi:hypothetical protein